MHELSLVTAMVQQIEAIMKKEGAKQLESVSMAIGALSGVEPESFAFCFPLVIEETPLKGAKLIIDKIPLRLGCLHCGQATEPDDLWMVCPLCGSSQVEVVTGRELTLTALDLC
ncbi:MAG: hydrogenase maturation nickel metallochaperone HypA [Magnetococcus sp. YQC-5]